MKPVVTKLFFSVSGPTEAYILQHLYLTNTNRTGVQVIVVKIPALYPESVLVYPDESLCESNRPLTG